MKNVKTRNSSIELLRIIAMLFIVLSHCVSHSNINMENLPMGFNKIFLQISTLGNLGVNLFLLITGFFSYNKKLNSQKIVYLWLNTFFYSLLTFFTIFLWTKDFSINVFIKSLFPITFNQYWFVTAFIIMMIVSPLLNKLIENISKREHFKLIIIGCFIWGFLKTITAQDYYGNQLMHFFLMYLIGAYIGKYNFIYNKKIIIILVLTSLMLIFSVIGLDLLIDIIKRPSLLKYSTYFFKRDSILMIILSVCIFLMFTNKSYENKAINYIYNSTFAVYLIHDNPLIRQLLWSIILKVNLFAKSSFLVIYIPVTVLLVFFTCILIDKLKNKILNGFMTKASSRIDMFIKKIINNIENYYIKNCQY